MKLVYHFYIKSSIDRIWSILTVPEESAKIFYGAKVKSTFEEGDFIEYIGPGRDGEKTLHIKGIVKDVIVNKKLAHTFIVVGEGERCSAHLSWTLPPSHAFCTI